MDKRANNNSKAMNKANESNDLKLRAITQSIKDNIPNMTLPFIETTAEEYYSVVLSSFYEVGYVDSTRFVLKGNLVISGSKTQEGCIEYNFFSGSFYRVIIMANGAIRRNKTLELDLDGKPTFDKLLTLMTNYIYSKEDYENNVNVNGAMSSKAH